MPHRPRRFPLRTPIPANRLVRFGTMAAFMVLSFALSTARAVTIDTVYFGQTHVLKATDTYFGLVGGREALIKVHVTDPATPASPAVTATLTLAGQTLVLPLTGPATLPASIPDGPGMVQHSFANTFTGYLPAAWVKKGLQVRVNAGTATTNITSIDVGAPTKVIMTMFDVQYFSDTNDTYPANTFAELEAKWPVADLEVRRLGHVVFPELVIPPRPDVGTKAVRVTSKENYRVQTGLSFDGEQDAASAWNGALKRASGRSGRWSLYYTNVYNAYAGGQAGGFAGVGSGTSVGILHHELGHALSLPHWGDNASYPYKGSMHGISAPASYNLTHAGPAWAFDLRTRKFIPPTVQSNNVGGEPVGTYKVDPMQGGGTGFQETGLLMNHFSDYSVDQMRSYLHGHVVVWNPTLNSYASWNQTAGDYTTTVGNNGVNFPTTRDTPVISILASISGSNPEVTMVYPPIGPYTSGLIRLFDPNVTADRTAAQSIFATSHPSGLDLCARVTQGGVVRTYMLPASWLTSPDPYTTGSLLTEAINLPAANGEVTRIELLLTPNVEDVGLPTNPQILSTWAPITPDPAAFVKAPVAYGPTAISMKAVEGVTSDASLGTVEYRFSETSGNPGGSTSAWQTSPAYTDLGLQPGFTYSYTVTLRAGTYTGTVSAVASATTLGPAANEAITVDATQEFNLQSGNGTKDVTGLGAFDAAGADKLVVALSTEDANNTGAGYVYSVKYNGKLMTQAIQEEGGAADGTAAIFYLDNPGAIGAGTIQVSANNPNGGIGCAYALSNTRTGFGNSNSRSGSFINAIGLTTGAERSLVLAVLDNAGNPNGSGTPTASAPQTQASSGAWGGSWGGHASGYQHVATPAAATATFATSTGTGYGINLAAVEILAKTVTPVVWTQTAGGAQSWTTGANWSGAAAPSPAAGATLDFSTVNIAGNTTLNLGATRTGQYWKFGDTSGSQRWIVSAGQTMTLAGTTPAIQVNNNSTQLDCVLDGTAGLVKLGAGALILNGANTLTGPTVVNGGTLRVAGTSAATPITVNGSAVLQPGSATGLSAANNVTLNGSARLDLLGNSVTVGTLVGQATSTITNSGTATTASTATAPGTPALTDALTIAPVLGASALASLITDGATRRTQIVMHNNNGNTTFTPTNTANTFSGGLVLAYNASVTPNGTRLMLNATNVDAVGVGPIIVGRAPTDKAGIYLSGASNLANQVVFNTALGTDRVGVRVDSAVTLSGTLTANLAPVTFTSNSGTGGHATVTGRITGPLGLVLDIVSSSAAASNFNVTLNNTGAVNNYSGDTVVNLNAAAGKTAILNLGSAHQIPNGPGAGNVVLNSTGTGAGRLNLGGFDEVINGLSGNGTVEGAAAGGVANTLTVGDNDATSTFIGLIRNTSGSLSLTKIGAGTLTLGSGSTTFTGHTYTGATTVEAGVLNLNTVNAIPNASSVTVHPGATLREQGVSGSLIGDTVGLTVNGAYELDKSESIGGLSGAGTVMARDLNNGNAGTESWTLTVGGGDASASFSGRLRDDGADARLSFVKTGTGTQTLSGASDHTGSTTVNAGRLVLTGSLTSTVTVAGGVFAPQGAPSTTAGLSVNAGGGIEFRLNGPNAGAQYDQLTVGGGVVLAGALNVAPGATFAPGQSFTLIHKTSTAAINGAFAGKPQGSVFSSGGHDWVMRYDGGDGNEVTVSVATASEKWRFTHFASALNTGAGADDQDANGDGERNLLEFATGQIPGAAGTAPLLIQLAGTAAECHFDQAHAALGDGVTFVVEWSGTPSGPTWQSSGVGAPVVVSDNGTVRRVKVTLPPAAETRYARLRVSRN